jgi:hypothetical protein
VILPKPVPGLVIRYAFLWSHERDAGREEAAKDRPCAIVLSARRDPTGDIVVVVAPITHVPPASDQPALPVPPDVAAQLGLDGDPSWIRIDELNRFAWPGFDLRPVPGGGGSVVYGMLPRDLYERMKRAILDGDRARRPITRD